MRTLLHIILLDCASRSLEMAKYISSTGTFETLLIIDEFFSSILTILSIKINKKDVDG